MNIVPTLLGDIITSFNIHLYKGPPLQSIQLHLSRHISTTRCRMDMKPSVLERGGQGESNNDSISLEYQLYLNRSGKVRG